jgi:hypothetical protein
VLALQLLATGTATGVATATTGVATGTATGVAKAQSNWHEGTGMKELALQLQLALQT